MDSNVIELIRTDIKRHQVEVILPGEEKSRMLFLIEVVAKTSKVEELPLVYGEKVSSLHLKVAEKIFGKQESENVYGVFVDENLKYVFAFNRDFADYNPEKRCVEYKELDDILVEKVEPRKVEPLTIPRSPRSRDRGRGGLGGGHTVLKYSLTEKKAE
jgi:hypothetical protein